MSRCLQLLNPTPIWTGCRGKSLQYLGGTWADNLRAGHGTLSVAAEPVERDNSRK